MSMDEMYGHDNANDLNQRVTSLEQRLATLENELIAVKQSGISEGKGSREDYEDMDLSLGLLNFGEKGGVESKIGEFGLSWLGGTVLFFGFVFLAQYVTNSGLPVVSAIIGYLAVAGILLVTKYTVVSFQYLSRILKIIAYILLFYTTVRLHFFTIPVVLSGQTLTVILLLVIVSYLFYESIRKRSEGFSVLPFLLSIIVSILSDDTYLMLSLSLGLSIIGFILFYRFSWYRVMIFSLVLAYFNFLTWMLNNPFMGHTIQSVPTHQFSYLFLAACGAVYSMITLVKERENAPENFVLTTVILNGLGFSFILGLMVLNFFPGNYVWIFSSIGLFCMFFSVLLKYFSIWKFTPALYALYGFVSISIMFYGIWDFPRAYLLLSLQSLLVVSMALWFRSKIIVVMNIVLFVGLLTGYAASGSSQVLINFSFPIVAFISARIINWKKERLTIKTELIRNSYLTVLFITMLFAVYRSFPSQYITLSWTAVVLLYFLISIILKNVKYRYLAVATMAVTTIYLFAIDLARIGVIFRIIAFMFLAIISIGISVYYVRKIKKKNPDQAGNSIP